MSNQPDNHSRAILPIPDSAYAGLVKYDAKDPESKFPPIEPLRPPPGAPRPRSYRPGAARGGADGGTCGRTR